MKNVLGYDACTMANKSSNPTAFDKPFFLLESRNSNRRCISCFTAMRVDRNIVFAQVFRVTRTYHVAISSKFRSTLKCGRLGRRRSVPV